MKSIQKSFLTLVLANILCVLAIISTIGYLNLNRMVEKDSTKIMNLVSDEKANSIDSQLLAIEQSLEMIAATIKESYDKNHDFSADTFEPICNTAYQYVSETQGANAFFFQLDPNRFPGQDGFIYVKRLDDGLFEYQTSSQFYNETHIRIPEIQGYKEPLENKTSMWVKPYANSYLQTQILSYSVPIYDSQNLLLGVLILDVRLDFIEEMVSKTKIYEHGYAYLADEDGNIISHKLLRFGDNMYKIEPSLNAMSVYLKSGERPTDLYLYQEGGKKHMMTFTTLRNGFRLIVTAPEKEIKAEQRIAQLRMFIPTIFVGIVFLIITLAMTYKLVHPLSELTTATEHIANGDLSVDLSYKSNNEIGILSENFRQMAYNLKRYVTHMNDIAYRDSLTGMNNKTAYQESILRVNESIKCGNAKFAIAVFDLNNLKYTNDTRGHSCGDKLISAAGTILRDTLTDSSVYRIGGDEFVAILENNDYARRHDLLNELTQKINDFNKDSELDFKLSMAQGMADYKYMIDKEYNDVFIRADSAMYKNKTQLKKNFVPRNEIPRTAANITKL